ncbi:MAG: UbiA family prenyltransferase [Candidatus Protistobacter heckmanni]|nr:UbiA family prenyltransferase [Candidatus Protistobacter heckmanni]
MEREALAHARQAGKPQRVFARERAGLSAWKRALRPHQWAKNLLLFLPMAAAHSLFDGPRLLATLAGFAAFSLCASATYIINDLLDVASDRAHPRKRERPFASGALSPQAGILAAGVLLPLSLVFGWLLSPMFCAVLAAYVVVTLAYSLALKREAFIDVLILAGGVASGIAVSNWLLAISGFLFLSLALVKRCAELEDSLADGREAPSARGYLQTDLPYLIGMGISSGFVAVLVIALYIGSQNSAVLYARPQLLWLACPLLLAWVMRLWIKTARRQMSDDPVLFALRDRFSWWVGAGVVAIAVLAGATPA